MPPALPSTVHNPTTGAVIPASWGDALNDYLDYQENGRARARVYRSGAPALTTGVRAPITFNLERFDFGGCHSTVSNTSRLVVPASEGGFYIAGAHGEFPAGGAVGSRQIGILQSGVTLIAVGDVPTNGVANVSTVTAYQLAAGDYLELAALQTSGGAMSMSIASAYSVEFWFVRICG